MSASVTQRPRGHRRRGERGVAMFVVLMIIVTVSAAGVFVANSSSLEIRSAGTVRQAGQSHYVAEGGASAVLARMRTNCRTYFSDYLRRQAHAAGVSGSIPAELRSCPTALTYVTTGVGIRAPITAVLPCYTFTSADFTAPLTVAPVFQAPSGMVPRTEGSFGVGGLSPRFEVLVTEIAADVAPIAGQDPSATNATTMPTRYEIRARGITEMDRGTFGLDTNNVVRGDEDFRAVTVLQCN